MRIATGAAAATVLVLLISLTSCASGSGQVTAAGPGPSASTAPPSSPSADAPTNGVTQQGRLLRDFEGFLYKTFGSRSVDVENKNPLGFNFTHRFRSMADTPPYTYTFQHPLSSRSFILTNTKPPILGNYPVPILVNGKFVKCAANSYLAKFQSTFSFSLGCVRV